MSKTNNGVVIIKADKERYLKMGIRQIRHLENEVLGMSLTKAFDENISFDTIYKMFKEILVGSEKLEDSDIEDIMDETVANLDNGLVDLVSLIIKASGGYIPSSKEKEEKVNGEEATKIPSR